MSAFLTVVDEAAVMNVLGQEVPDLPVQRITFHHAYADRCVVEINDSLILKFPLREEAREWMAREHWVLNALQGQTTIATPTPAFVARQVFCYGYQKVPGILLTDEQYWNLTTRQKQPQCRKWCCMAIYMAGTSHLTQPPSNSSVSSTFMERVSVIPTWTSGTFSTLILPC